MKDPKPEILYSDPVNEIMGNPPPKILRWGNGVMVLVFILFVLFAWLIRYPDTIPSPVEITTTNPPVTLMTKISGRIKVFYPKDKDTVKAGQILVVIETSASMDEIELLQQTIDTIRKPEFLASQMLPEFSMLGEMQSYFAAFLKALNDLNNYTNNDLLGNKIKSLSEEISGIQEYLNRLKEKENLYIENQEIESNKYKRSSNLYNEGVISEVDLEIASQSLLAIKMELQQVRLDHASKTIELAEKRQTLEDYRIMRNVERENFVAILDESLSNLKGQMRIWINDYLLISPVEGIVSLTRFWSENQSVIKDEAVINVVPLETGSFLGRVNLKMHRSGKVDTGQIVNIKLSSYPYMEFGMVKGVVKSISLVPAAEEYIIEIDLPEGLTTSYDINLNFTQNMQGTAEIITKDIRLLQKIVNPFRYLISKNKR